MVRVLRCSAFQPIGNNCQSVLGVFFCPPPLDLYRFPHELLYFLFPLSNSTKSSCTAAGMRCLAEPQMTFPQKWRTGGRSNWLDLCSARRACWCVVPPPTRACLQTTPPPTPPTSRSTCLAASYTSQRRDPRAGQSPPHSRFSMNIVTPYLTKNLRSPRSCTICIQIQQKDRKSTDLAQIPKCFLFSIMEKLPALVN